jgi:ABC-type hemin transport system substrate-binding protein
MTCPNCRGRARVKLDGTLAEHTNRFGAVCRLVGKLPSGECPPDTTKRPAIREG